jgi:hypothetical protein
VVTVGVLGTWGELALTGGHHTAAASGSVSQDATTQSGDPADESTASPAADDSGAEVKAGEILTAPSISASGYTGTLSATEDGSDCDKVLAPGIGPAASPGPACEGYARGDYVSSGDTVYTSVTVLGFPARADAQRAATRFSYSDVGFVQPGGALPAMSPQAAENTYRGKVATIGRFVTVTVSAYADGHRADAALQAPTEDVAFTVGQSVLWF